MATMKFEVSFILDQDALSVEINSKQIQDDAIALEVISPYTLDSLAKVIYVIAKALNDLPEKQK